MFSVAAKSLVTHTRTGQYASDRVDGVDVMSPLSGFEQSAEPGDHCVEPVFEVVTRMHLGYLVAVVGEPLSLRPLDRCAASRRVRSIVSIAALPVVQLSNVRKAGTASAAGNPASSRMSSSASSSRRLFFMSTYASASLRPGYCFMASLCHDQRAESLIPRARLHRGHFNRGVHVVTDPPEQGVFAFDVVIGRHRAHA